MISSLSPDVADVAAMMTTTFRKSCFLFMRESCPEMFWGLPDDRFSYIIDSNDLHLIAEIPGTK